MNPIEEFKINIKPIENKFKKKRIVIVCGGFSEERETSIESGNAVFLELNRRGFNVLKMELAAVLYFL